MPIVVNSLNLCVLRVVNIETGFFLPLRNQLWSSSPSRLQHVTGQRDNQRVGGLQQ